MTTYKLNANNQILEILYVYILICPDIVNKILFKPNNFNNLTLEIHYGFMRRAVAQLVDC